jgi:alpha-D-ribose 1-methylphosphonate 5-triphosphate synthase subunit PhnI
MKNIVEAQSSNFLISIYHQDNFSYRGEIHWLDTGKKLCFRSELELMNLMHEATSLQQNPEVQLRTWESATQVKVV